MAPAEARQEIDGVNKQAVGYKQQYCARNIHRHFPFGFGFGNDFPGEIGAPQSDGQVDIENPAPANGIDEKSSERWPSKKTDMKRGRRKPQRPAPFFSR